MLFIKTSAELLGVQEKALQGSRCTCRLPNSPQQTAHEADQLSSLRTLPVPHEDEPEPSSNTYMGLLTNSRPVPPPLKRSWPLSLLGALSPGSAPSSAPVSAADIPSRYDENFPYMFLVTDASKV